MPRNILLESARKLYDNNGECIDVISTCKACPFENLPECNSKTIKRLAKRYIKDHKALPYKTKYSPSTVTNVVGAS